MKKQSVSMQAQMNNSGISGYVLKPNNLNYIIGGSCVSGGVLLYLVLTIAGFNTGALLFVKVAFVAVWEVLGLLFILWTYQFRITVTNDGISIKKAFGGSNYYMWGRITGAEQVYKQMTSYIYLYSAQEKVLSVNRSYSNYERLEQDLADRGLFN